MKKAEIRKLDALWQKVVKQLSRCEKCGKSAKPRGLHAHHFKGRGRGIRWMVANGICLCAWCHRFGPESAHRSPKVFEGWFRKYRPTDYEKVVKARPKVAKYQDYEEIKLELEKWL